MGLNMKVIFCLMPIIFSIGFALKCQQCSNEDTNFKCSSINDNGNEVECKAGEDYCVYVTYSDGTNPYIHRAGCVPKSQLLGYSSFNYITSFAILSEDERNPPWGNMCSCNKDNCNKSLKCHQCSSKLTAYLCSDSDDTGKEQSCDEPGMICSSVYYSYDGEDYAHRGCSPIDPVSNENDVCKTMASIPELGSVRSYLTQYM